MKVEQPRELNSLVDDSIPLTWNYRWQRFRVLVPFLALLVIVTIERALLGAWLKDKLDVSTISVAVIASFSFFLFFFILLEGEIRFRHRTTRVLEAKDKGVFLKPMRGEFIHWDLIRTFRFEPFLHRSDLVKLTVEYAASRKSKIIRYWSMALSKTEQVDNLTSELEFRRQRGTGSFALLSSAEPLVAPPVPQKMALLPFWVCVLGFWLLAHGIPLLFISFPDHDKGLDARRAKIERVSKKEAQSSRSAAKAERVRSLFGPHRIPVGCALTGLGLGFYAWGMILIYRTKKSGLMPEPNSPSAQAIPSAGVNP
jgi:hypothetical protein